MRMLNHNSLIEFEIIETIMKNLRKRINKNK